MNWKKAKNIISRDSHLQYITNDEAKAAHEMATNDIKFHDTEDDFLDKMTRSIEILRTHKLL